TTESPQRAGVGGAAIVSGDRIGGTDQRELGEERINRGALGAVLGHQAGGRQDDEIQQGQKPGRPRHRASRSGRVQGFDSRESPYWKCTAKLSSLPLPSAIGTSSRVSVVLIASEPLV